MAEFKLPNLGEGVTKGEVVGLSVKAGDVVAKGQAVAEVETDKAVAEVTANFDGKVTAVNVKVGDKVTPGAVLLSYEAGAAAATPAAAPVKAAGPANAAAPAS
jgi:pyruvate dehydrogenase E2 component (dihydrolipoamide acetyltransferase)